MEPVKKNGLKQLVERLRKANTLTHEAIREELASADISLADTMPWERFDGNHYTRNLVFANERFQVLVLCWKPEQASPVHDHAASHCGVRVVSGVATESQYSDLTSTQPESTRQLTAGDVTANPGAFIHKVANATQERLVTVHVYAPPLVSVAAD